MTDSMHRKSGQCRCGKLQFEVNSKPLVTMLCHCTGCQRMTASAYSLSALYPSQAFKVTAGEPVVGGLHGATRHYFCAYCMSWLFTRPEGMDEFVNIRSTMMAYDATLAPFIETYTDEKLPWVRAPAVHSFPKFPPPERFPGMLAEFANKIK